MFSYILLVFISKIFGLKTLTTKYVFHHINKIFKISDQTIVSVIEDSFCHVFNDLTVIEKMDAFGYTEDEDTECGVDTNNVSFEYFTGHFSNLDKSKERKGKLIIFHPYPLGYSIGKFPIKNRDHIIKDVNIPVTFVKENFQFHDHFMTWSLDVLKKTEKDFRRRKKLKKKSPVTFVGIHNRRGDHLVDQVKEGVGELLPGYFLGGMDFFRDRYKNVIFLYVSDDMDWGKRRLLPRVRSGDLYLVGALSEQPLYVDDEDGDQAAGQDLALLSHCNHTILSYGTFSYWAGLLAGGTIFTPENYENIEYFI